MIHAKHKNGPVVLVGHRLGLSFPFSYGYLAGYLIDRGEDVRMLFRPKTWEEHKALAEEIIALKPLLVGFGNLYPEIYEIKNVIAWLRKLGCNFPVVVGGHLVTPTPEFAVEITDSDIGVVGEGEIILYNLVQTLRSGEDIAQVKGLVIREGIDFSHTGQGEYIKDLSTLPKIPYHLFPSEIWTASGKWFTFVPQPQWRYRDRSIYVHGGRGCPFNCNFCYHHSRPRYRDVDEMMSEAFSLLERFDCNVINFSDDLVLASPKRAGRLTEILSKHKSKRKIAYRVSCRFDILDRIDDHLLREMKRTGCRVMPMGVESGSQRILDVMKKRTTVDQILRGVERLWKVGIYVSGNMMLGQVTETEEDADKSIALAKELIRINKHIQLSSTITTPLPGTAIYRYAMEKNLIKSHQDFFNLFKNMGGISVNVSDMSNELLMAKKKEFDNALLEQKKHTVGRSAVFVEKMIRKLADIDASPKTEGIKKFRYYNQIYDSVQHTLDMTRRVLRGVE